MKISLFLLGVGLSGLLGAISQVANAQQNLIENPGFEGRNAVPSTRQNVGPYVSAGVNTRHDDLQVWDALPTRVASGVTAYDNGGSYLSTDGVGDGSLSTLGTAPHDGISAVLIQQHDNNGDHNYDQFVTQKLAKPLLAGHRYEVKFWAKRLQPSVAFRTKLAFYITNSSPFYDLASTSPTKYNIVPSPGSKVLVSDDVQADRGWTLVSGFITIPANETTNQWVTIGYDRSNQYYDSSIPNTVANGAINYLLDDVSLRDVGCPLPTTPEVYPPDWTCDSPASTRVVMANYDPTATYTITTTGGIYNSPSGIYAENTAQGTRWVFQLLRTTAGETSTITVASSSVCGTSSLHFDVNAPICTGGGGGGGGDPEANRAAYPNPATEFVLIPAGAKNVVLFNSRGKAVLQPATTGRLDVQGLPAGLYNLQMSQGGKRTNQRIEVRH